MDELLIIANHTPAFFTQRTRIVSVITAKELHSNPVTGVDEVLKGFSSVDLRQRGGHGVQSDVSIRGGHYEQTLVLLNGVNFSDPQTGHFNMNLPVCFESVRQIEVLYGSYARTLGANAMSGAVNVVSVPEDTSYVGVSAMAGAYDLYRVGVQMNLAGEKAKHFLAVNRSSSKGYIENTDFKNLNAYYSGNVQSHHGILDFQTGYSQRQFGANSFYTPRFPNQFEAIGTAIASVRFQSNGKINMIPLIYWRHNTDRFELFRSFENAPSWYTDHNFHKTQVLGASFSAFTETKAGRTSLSFTYRNEEIYSTVLGMQLSQPVPVKGELISYSKYYSRDYTSIMLEQQLSYKRLFASAGIMANLNSDISNWKFLPGIDASYLISKKLKAVASVNTSLRMPTFTDLFYRSPTLLGNPNLQYEQALTTEAGLKYFDNAISLQLSGFERRGKNLIDWIKYPGDSLWRSENITEINYLGLEFSCVLFPELMGKELRFFPEARLSYTYLHVDRVSNDFQSAYALDQLRHKANLYVSFKILKNLGISCRLSYFNRYGSYMKYVNGVADELTPYDDFLLSDLRVYMISGNWNAYADVTNLFNRKYFDIGNIEQPGRWIRIGGSYKLKLKKNNFSKS